VSSTVRRRPTILDIAAAAGVSKSLVSLALRGDAGVSDATRDRIVDIAERLGYRSNAVARALVQGRTATVGAVATELANPYHSEVIGGVERAAEHLGFDVLISHGRRDPKRIVHRIERMLELNLDAIVVVSSWAPREVLRSAARHVPIVVVGRMPEPVAGVDSIVSDDEAGARAAVEHVLASGYRTVGFATSSHRPAALAREAGYRAAVRNRSPMRVVDVSADSGDGAIARMLDHAGRPDAVIANNDVTAVRIMDAALDRSLRIPHDLAIVGYDDTTLARLVRPALTSVDQPNDEIGRIAMGMVKERLGGRTTDRHEIVRPRLVVRASSQRETR
jgi:DNA-binding LacI/PurR family transcriptional regulator